jgi:hypothetical protein
VGGTEPVSASHSCIKSSAVYEFIPEAAPEYEEFIEFCKFDSFLMYWMSLSHHGLWIGIGGVYKGLLCLENLRNTLIIVILSSHFYLFPAPMINDAVGNDRNWRIE